MAHSRGDARCPGGAGPNPVANAGFALSGNGRVEMFVRRNRLPVLVGQVLILVSLAWALNACGAVVEATPPAEAAEPAAPAATEEPVMVQPTAPSSATSLPAMLPTPTPAVLIPVTGGGGYEPEPAILESRRLTLEFPPVMRTGDSTRIRLQLEVDDQGNITPTAVVEGNVVKGEVVEIPNLYETHNVIAEARMDMAGMEVQPAGTISEPLTQGSSVTFYWSVRPPEAGTYEGTVWLHVRFIPKNGGEESRIPVSVQFVEIKANSFMGFMSGRFARGVGALGSVVGSVLGFPFADDFLKWLWRRIRRK